MAAESSPSVVVISGPNGAGKSTAAPRLLRGKLAVSAFVNADVIARGLSAFEPERVALEAGRMMLLRFDGLVAARQSFAFETTLASRSFAPRIREMIRSGYLFHLIYLWLPNSDLAVARVSARVQTGGHNVPEHDIRRRRLRGLRNFFSLYQPMSTSWRMYDNSDPTRSRLVAGGVQLRATTVRNPSLWDSIQDEVKDDRGTASDSD